MDTTKNKKVDAFLRNEKKWREEQSYLREIALSTGLTEDFKWMHPCYTLSSANVFLIHGFKEYFAILFFKGAAMKDPKKILVRQSENVQAGRQIRFTSMTELVKMKKVIKSYMEEAATIEEAGISVVKSAATELVIPLNVEKVLKRTPGLLPAFKKLTPGRRRAYVLYFTGAKQEKTVIARVEKSIPSILIGKGLNE